MFENVKYVISENAAIKDNSFDKDLEIQRLKWRLLGRHCAGNFMSIRTICKYVYTYCILCCPIVLSPVGKDEKDIALHWLHWRKRNGCVLSQLLCIHYVYT